MNLVDRIATYRSNTPPVAKANLKKFSSQEVLPTQSYFDNFNALKIQDQLARRPYDDNDRRLQGDDGLRKIADSYRGGDLPASAPETSRNNIGKVRQLFEERRKQIRRPLQTALLTNRATAIGRDKSYPLQPIRRRRQNTTRDDDIVNDTDDTVNVDITQPIIYDCSIFGRLPNLGGRLLSERKPVESDTKSFSQSADMSTSTRRNVNSSVSRITEGISKLTTKPATNGIPQRIPTNRLQSSPKQINALQPTKKPSQSATTVPIPTSNNVNTDRTVVDENKNINTRKTIANVAVKEIKKPSTQPIPSKKRPVANGTVPLKSTVAKSKPTLVKNPPPPGMSSCSICGRNFADDRLKKHQEICEKASKTKRKKFDPLKQRLRGTDAEGLINQIKSTIKTPPPAKKGSWRKQHEEFINNIRAARMVKQHLSKGGKLSDLPPPPPSDTSDYVQCPHCGRKFNDAAATRHIPLCANMRHNKPKNIPTKQSDTSKIRKTNATKKR